MYDDLTGHDHMDSTKSIKIPQQTIRPQSVIKVFRNYDICSSSNICENELYRVVAGDATNVHCAETLFQRRQALHIETFQEHQLG